MNYWLSSSPHENWIYWRKMDICQGVCGTTKTTLRQGDLILAWRGGDSLIFQQRATWDIGGPLILFWVAIKEPGNTAKNCTSFLNSFWPKNKVKTLTSLALITDWLNRKSIMTLAQCLKITQNVALEFWNFPQILSYLDFWILAFSFNFCLIKIDLSGNTIWLQASCFSKTR